MAWKLEQKQKLTLLIDWQTKLNQINKLFTMSLHTTQVELAGSLSNEYNSEEGRKEKSVKLP